MKLTADEIKKSCKQYDLGALAELDLSCRGIVDAQAIEECINAESVILSGNQIASLDLTALSCLKTVDLSDNQISSLAAIKLPEGVKTLRLQGNRIHDIGELNALRSLPLSTLYFRDRDGGRANPLTGHASYAIVIMRYFPDLTHLDGEALALKDLAEDDRLDKVEAPAPPLQLSPSKPWLEHFDWGNSFKSCAPETDKLASRVEKTLRECEALCDEADEAIAHS